MAKIKLLIADDHQVVRSGLRAIFELEDDFEVVTEASDGEEVVNKAKRFSPQVILMDIRMPKLDGIAASQKIKEFLPKAKILILTSYQSEEEVNQAIKAKVDGYLLKDAPAAEIIKAVRGVNKGESFLHPSVTRKVIDGYLKSSKEREEKASYNLTSRELEVLQLMSEGYKNKDIAAKLWLAETTVKAHAGKIMQKLGAADRTQAIVFALQKGLIEVRKEG